MSLGSPNKRNDVQPVNAEVLGRGTETKEQKEKPQERPDYQAQIDLVLKTRKDGQESPEMNAQDGKAAEKLLRGIPASEFLQRNTEDLSALFLDAEGVVDFGGNDAVVRLIGLGDMFDRDQPYLVVDGVVGVRGIVDGKVGYLDSSGSYLPVFGGEQVGIKVTNEEVQQFQEETQDMGVVLPTEAEETEAKQGFLKRVEQGEKAEGEVRDALRERGINPEGLSSEEAFVAFAKDVAKEIEVSYGIPWQVTLAQTSLETGFGKHLAGGNNFFGIKGRGGNEQMTTEVMGGQAVQRRESFRAYDNVVESFLDYARLISGSPRYRGAFEYKDDPKAFLDAVIRAGYATDSQYVEKAESVLNRHGYSLDKNRAFV